jgi:hypothetical protein
MIMAHYSNRVLLFSKQTQLLVNVMDGIKDVKIHLVYSAADKQYIEFTEKSGRKTINFILPNGKVK